MEFDKALNLPKRFAKIWAALKTYINVAHIGVAEKHDFCGIQQKILQVSDFAKKRDSNPPWGYCGRHCENVC
jgi:hypothetical protein